MAALGVTNVSTFAQPSYDYAADLAAIDRQRRLAQALQDQSLQPEQQQTAGGYVVPFAQSQGLAKIAQALSGAFGQHMADQKQHDLSAKVQSDYTDMAGRFSKALAGTPATDGTPSPSTPTDEALGHYDPATPGTAAVPGDPMKALTIAGSNPMGAPLAGIAVDQIKRDMMMKQLQAALGGGGTPAAPAGPAAPSAFPTQDAAAGAGQLGAPTAPSAPPAGPAGNGLLVDPTALRLLAASGDPTAIAKLAEMQQTAYAKSQEPVVNRGFGLGRMVNGQYVPDAASLDQALAMERGKNNITQPYEPPVQVPLSGGQTASLSRPEYADFQRTGQLPVRYGQAGQQAPATAGGTPPQPAPAPPQGAPAAVPAVPPAVDAQGNPIRVPALDGVTMPPPLVPRGAAPGAQPPGLGVPGLTQSQQDVIDQQGQAAQATTAGKQRADLTFSAPEARNSVADATSNLDRLIREATLIKNDPALSRISGATGMFPDWPGGKAADLDARLNSLKSQVGFGVLQAMRNASKTGGALGSVSDAENHLLQNNLSSLDTKQSPEGLQRNLQQVIDYAIGAKQRMLRAYSDQYERVQGNQGMQPGPQGAQPVGAGGAGSKSAQSIFDAADAILNRGK